MIAPTFESLSTKYSKPNKITFCKVDVDNQQAVAQMYSVRAMPTFLILHKGTVVETVQGANPPALSAAVEKGVKLAGTAAGPAFGSSGHRLGGAGVAPRAGGRSLGRPARWDLGKFLQAVYTFLGLYFISLFSVCITPDCIERKRGWLTDVVYSSTLTRLLKTRSSTESTLHQKRFRGRPLARGQLFLEGPAASRPWLTWERADGG